MAEWKCRGIPHKCATTISLHLNAYLIPLKLLIETEKLKHQLYEEKFISQYLIIISGCHLRKLNYLKNWYKIFKKCCFK